MLYSVIPLRCHSGAYPPLNAAEVLLEVQFNRTKFKQLVLYICSNCAPTQLGAVKLNKVLYFADMIKFAGTGTPLTGARYRKRPYGPTADALLPTLRELEQEGAIRVEEMDYFGYRKKMYVPLRDPDAFLFGDDEKLLVKDIIEFVCYNNTAKTISELSHNKAWELAEFGADIPYHTAYCLFPTMVSEETIEWAKNEEAEIEAQRSQGRQVVYQSLRDFREKMARGGRS
jgi:hypothetical protein